MLQCHVINKDIYIVRKTNGITISVTDGGLGNAENVGELLLISQNDQVQM